MDLARRSILGMSAAALATSTLGRFSAHAQDATPTPGAIPFTISLLTIRGALASATLEDARTLHNQTAGDPASIAAARSLGDISHMVYVPLTPAMDGAGEVLFMDLWTSLEGLDQFFANPQVQAQAAQIFATRDPVVWEPAGGFFSYLLPAPSGQNDRVIAVVRGMVGSRAEAMADHNAIVESQINNARLAGSLSHDAYFRLAAPGDAETLEFLAVDVWLSASGMEQFYADPDCQISPQALFVTPPDTSLWTSPASAWTEW